jgi:hypothetical protein
MGSSGYTGSITGTLIGSDTGSSGSKKLYDILPTYKTSPEIE